MDWKLPSPQADAKLKANEAWHRYYSVKRDDDARLQALADWVRAEAEFRLISS